MAHLLARLTPNRFINLNHIIDLSFYEQKDEDNKIISFEVNIKFTDGIQEKIYLTPESFSNFYQEVKNALV